jgi:hypothetical protein
VVFETVPLLCVSEKCTGEGRAYITVKFRIRITHRLILMNNSLTV